MRAFTSSLLFSAGALAGGALLAGCHADRGAEQAVSPAVPAQVITIQAEPAIAYATVPGTVVSKRHAEVASRLTGYVQSVKVQAGDRVEAGQPLLAIDSSDVTGQLQQAQAVFDEAEVNYQRSSSLYAKGVATRVQLDDATRQFSTAKAALQMARAAVGYADIRAPFAGVVVDKFADPGDLATPGKPLLVLEDERALEVQSYVPEDLYGALRLGEDISYATEDGSYHGRLQSKVQAADAQTHTHLIRIEVPAGAGLMSGRYVRVSIPSGSAPAVRVPASALVERAGISGVFVVDPDGQAHFRLVRAGDRRDGQIDIQSGLAAGERIVLAPGDAIDNGTRLAVAGAGP